MWRKSGQARKFSRVFATKTPGKHVTGTGWEAVDSPSEPSLAPQTCSPHSSCCRPSFLALPPAQSHPCGEKWWEDEPEEESAPRKLFSAAKSGSRPSGPSWEPAVLPLRGSLPEACIPVSRGRSIPRQNPLLHKIPKSHIVSSTFNLLTLHVGISATLFAVLHPIAPWEKGWQPTSWISL